MRKRTWLNVQSMLVRKPGNSWVTPTFSSVSFDRKLAYLVFRLSLGINILIHGSSRMFGSGADAFASKTTSELAGTALPHGLVQAFLTALPFGEFILGVLITVGLLTRWALTLGGLLITALIFGTALRSDWATVGIQMIYSITYYLLLANMVDNRFSLDTLFRRKRT
jgi:thiosulfate dehydrogenase (quinone) large subunit